jgi:hypothetical protein
MSPPRADLHFAGARIMHMRRNSLLFQAFGNS